MGMLQSLWFAVASLNFLVAAAAVVAVWLLLNCWLEQEVAAHPEALEPWQTGWQRRTMPVAVALVAGLFAWYGTPALVGLF